VADAADTSAATWYFPAQLQTRGLDELPNHAADVAGLAGVGIELEPHVLNGLGPHIELRAVEILPAARKDVCNGHSAPIVGIQSRLTYQMADSTPDST
jgi:hypothetical protein